MTIDTTSATVQEFTDNPERARIKEAQKKYIPQKVVIIYDPKPSDTKDGRKSEKPTKVETTVTTDEINGEESTFQLSALISQNQDNEDIEVEGTMTQIAPLSAGKPLIFDFFTTIFNGEAQMQYNLRDAPEKDHALTILLTNSRQPT